MTTYYHALQAMEYLLDRARDKYWCDWIREDIRRWQASRDVTYHLSAYGGMGSFNDVVLCRANGHRVTKAQEPWVQTLFDLLKGICYRLAHAPHTDQPLSRLLSPGTRHMPVVEAFKHEPRDRGALARLARQMEGLGTQLHGWRCLDCGHAETSPYDLEVFIARQTLPTCLIRVGRVSDLKRIVDAAYAVDFPNLEALRERLARAILKSEISLRRRKGWMRPCPRCGSKNTAVYRWIQVASDPLAFRPAKDNLPVK